MTQAMRVGICLHPREMDGLTRWPGVWTKRNSLSSSWKSVSLNVLVSLTHSSWPCPLVLFSLPVSATLRIRSQVPLPTSCCLVSAPFWGLKGTQAITLPASRGFFLGKCGLQGCPPALYSPPGPPSTLCSPRQSNMAVSWWKLDSEEFNRSWISSRSF